MAANEESERRTRVLGFIVKNASAGAYVERVHEKSGEELNKAKLEHVYELSKICDKKFKRVNAAVRFSVVVFAAAILYGLIWL